LQRKILHILELLQVSGFSIFWLLIEPTFWATKLLQYWIMWAMILADTIGFCKQFVMYADESKQHKYV
jgi:hypothetical protein